MQLQTPEVSAEHLLDLPATLEPELSMLLQQYEAVFEKPYGLPPSRSHDHSIPLAANTPPIKVRPYRYPHSQKSEIYRTHLC